MTTADPWLVQVRAALQRARPLTEAEHAIPGQPGLYAVHGDADVWRELGLGEPPDDRPLYVGKAERSLIVRDVKTHFGDGRTGASTLRRSFAALLRDSLGLRGIPRNPARPDHFANYGLSAGHDATLTRWMRERLALATWGRPSDCALPLLILERALIDELHPPLNLTGSVTPWGGRIKAARAVMTLEARAWTPDRR